jgi:hypothetical protein
MQALTYISGIRSLRNELRPKAAKKQQYLFTDRIDESDICEIDHQRRPVTAARHERATVLCIVARESAFKPEADSVRGLVYVDA